MPEEENNKLQIACGNKVASENKIKVALINLDVDFNGLKDVIASFFPSMRNEILIRYRAETIAKIGLEAYKIAKNENIPINPIPPKIALPLIEKMSLEHEVDMYEKWARLLIAAGVNSNPIHQQFADILSNLDNHSANFLKEIYTHPSEPNAENDFDEYIDKSRFKDCYDEIKGRTTSYPYETGRHNSSLPDSFGTINTSFYFPLNIYGTKKTVETYTSHYENDKPFIIQNNILKFTNEDKNLLLGLEKHRLIKYMYIYSEEGKDEDRNTIFVERCGVLLMQFGYSFVDCLEHPIK
jgi:hypothetical protein